MASPPSARPSEQIHHRDALKLDRARGAVNCRPSTTVCTEAWSTQSRYILSRRGPSRRRAPCPLYTMAVRSQCDFFSRSAIFFISDAALLWKKHQENCLRSALWLRCGFCQITLTSCFNNHYFYWQIIIVAAVQYGHGTQHGITSCVCAADARDVSRDQRVFTSGRACAA